MNMLDSARWCRFWQWITGTRVYRKVSEALLRAQATLRLARLDACRTDRAQLVALQWMVHRARKTRFAREHDFSRIGGIGLDRVRDQEEVPERRPK